MLGATSLVVSAVVPASAQTKPDARAAPKMKMTTDIPPSITTPDKVETRIGTLNFFDGFPDKATVEKVYDNLDFQRGLQAYLTALPAVSIEGFRKSYAAIGPVNQTVLISEQLLDAKSLFLTANTTTPYTVLYLDTKDGPLVLEIPPEVLGPIDDAWFRWVTDVGLTGPDKGKGGKYLLLPPGYTAEVPEGYFVARSRTFANLMFFRTFLKDGDAKPGVDSVKKNLRVYLLSQAANPPEMKFVNISGLAFNTIGPGDYSLFEYVNRVIQNEPSDAVDPDTLGLFAAIGIEKGKPFGPDDRLKKILMDAAAVGDATARSLAYETRIKDAYFYPNSAWVTPFPGGSYKFEENGAVNLNAKAHVLLLCHRHHTGDDGENGRERLAVRRCIRRCQGQPPRRQQDLQSAYASQHSRQEFLVVHAVRQPDPLHAPDRPTIPGSRQLDQGIAGQCRWVGGCLFRTEGSSG